MAASPDRLPENDGVGSADTERHPDVVSQLLRILEILRRRWLVVAVTTVVALASGVLAISLLEPKWRASSTVVLHMSEPQVLDKVEGVTEETEGRVAGYREYYQTQRRILGSRTVAERALAELGLADDPVFLGIDDIRSEPERIARRNEIDPVERLREIVDIQEVRNSRVVAVSADYPTPEIAAEIANAVVASYLTHVRSTRSRLGRQAESNLNSERNKSLEELRRAEKQLAKFKREHAITSVSLEDRQNVITQNILTLSSNVKQAQAERIELESMYKQAKQLHNTGNLAASTLLPDYQQTLFEALRADQVEAQRQFERVNVEYGPKAPEYKKAQTRLQLIEDKITKESSDLLQSLQARLRAARQSERQLEQALQAEQDDALQLTLLEREYQELERESKIAAEAYSMVSRRETEIEMMNRVGTESIEVLDRATVPKEPFSPNKPLIVALALIGGLSLGSLLALTIDFRDQRIRGLSDLERAVAGFRLPVLGQLPVIPADARIGAGNIRAQRRQRDLYAHLFPQSLMAERCRGVRTSLAFAQGERPFRTLMITSPSSTEGKSSTAMNLALSFCQAQKRVILVDADMRRPRLHQVFPPPVDREGIGLAQVLQGKAALSEAIMVPDDEQAPANLQVLPCGEPPENPAELLDSPAARRVLAELCEISDVVIVDTPPVLPVTDPMVLARLVDGVCLVARCESTTRSALQQAIGQLRQGDTNLVGVVLNDVQSRNDRYAYDYGYYAYRPRSEQPEQA